MEQVVKLELRRLAGFLKDDEETFAEILSQKTNKDILRKQKHLESELNKAISRNEVVSKLYEKLYEDNATGKVTDEWFMQLSHKYEVERMELKAKISDTRQKTGRYRRDAVRQRRIYLGNTQIHADGYADSAAATRTDRPYRGLRDGGRGQETYPAHCDLLPFCGVY